jgi:hypothetical protein
MVIIPGTDMVPGHGMGSWNSMAPSLWWDFACGISPLNQGAGGELLVSQNPTRKSKVQFIGIQKLH